MAEARDYLHARFWDIDLDEADWLPAARPLRPEPFRAGALTTWIQLRLARL